MTDKMTVDEPKELPLVKEGDYKAKIIEIEADKDGQFGKMLVFHFDVEGIDVQALASQKLNPNTKLFRWVELLTGEKPKVGEDIIFQDLVGKEALVTVRNKIVLDENGKEQKDTDGKIIKTSNIKEIRKAE